MEWPISIQFKWRHNGKEKDNSQPTPSLMVPAVRVAQDGFYSTLGPATQDITRHQELLKASIMGPVRDVVCIVGGTPGDMLANFHDLAERQHLLNNLGVLAAFSGTHGNLPRLKAIQAHHEPRVRRAGGPKGKLGVYDLTSYHVIARTIDSLSSPGGNATDPVAADITLQTDPRKADAVVQFTREVAGCLRSHQVGGCTLFTIETGGGSDTDQQLAVGTFRELGAVNRHYRLYLDPSPFEEPLHVANMRAKVAYELSHEPDIPTINLWWPQETSGPKPEDKAVAAGVMILTSNAPDHHEDDPSSHATMMLAHGSWFLVVPRIVPVPLKDIDFLQGKTPHMSRVDLPESLGGRQVSELLQTIRQLVMEDPSADHTFTVAGALSSEEIGEIKRGGRRFRINGGGQVRVVAGYMNPEIKDGEALYLVCDFRAGSQVYQRLRDLMVNREHAKRNGVDWAELRQLAAHLPELTVAEGIHRDLEHIRRVTRRW